MGAIMSFIDKKPKFAVIMPKIHEFRVITHNHLQKRVSLIYSVVRGREKFLQVPMIRKD